MAVFTFLRQLGSAIGLMLIGGLILRAKIRIDDRKTFLLVLTSGFMMCGVNWVYIIGNKFTSADVTAIFQAFTPIDGVVIGALFGTEKISLLKVPCFVQ